MHDVWGREAQTLSLQELRVQHDAPRQDMPEVRASDGGAMTNERAAGIAHQERELTRVQVEVRCHRCEGPHGEGCYRMIEFEPVINSYDQLFQMLLVACVMEKDTPPAWELERVARTFIETTHFLSHTDTAAFRREEA